MTLATLFQYNHIKRVYYFRNTVCKHNVTKEGNVLLWGGTNIFSV